MKKEALERAVVYIGSWLRFQYERGDIPGFVVAIAYKGRVVLNEAYGYANLEKAEKLTPSHLFRIASHSKTFTATAIMQLQEQGKLRIDDYAVNYLPWLNQHNDKRWQKVTIRQLLSHGAGVIRDGLKNDFWSVEEPFPSEDRFKSDILESGLVIDNNTKLKYSNYGYTLLGIIVAEVSGKPYNQYVIENIVKPLGLKNTGPELDRNMENKLVTGYSLPGPHKKRLPIVQIDTQAMSPATGFYSNSEDLCKYFTAHMPGSGKLLNDESKKEMRHTQWQAQNTSEKIEYGLGLEIEYVDERKMFGHGGGFPGHITQSYFDPEQELVVVILTNAMGGWADYINRCVIKALDYFQDNGQDSRWTKYQGRYMNLWWNADIITAGDKLIAVATDSWEPFKQPSELEHLKGNTFKISKTDSFNSADENVEFELVADGRVKKMIYAGATMLPEEEYIKRMSKKKSIG